MEFEKLEPFLPTADEIREMSMDDFESWIWKAKRILPQRAEIRDPLFHLKKRISTILEDKEIPEEAREARVLCEIERYNRIISQSQ